MSDDPSRRVFLKWLSAGTGAACVGGIGAGCAGPSGGGGEGANDADAAGIADGGAGGDALRDADGRSPIGGGDVGDSGRSGDTSRTGDGESSDSQAGDGGEPDPDGGSCETTGSDVEGPFFEEGAPERKKIAPDDEPGRRIVIEGTVYESDCRTPVPGAVLDVWHASEEGDYYDASENYRLRGQLKSASDGSYQIRTIKPGRYRSAGGLRPAHVHFTISSPQFEPLTTQMYFEGDPQLQNDPCGVCNSSDSSLIVEFSAERRNGDEMLVGIFDIVLGG